MDVPAPAFNYISPLKETGHQINRFWQILIGYRRSVNTKKWLFYNNVTKVKIGMASGQTRNFIDLRRYRYGWIFQLLSLWNYPTSVHVMCRCCSWLPAAWPTTQMQMHNKRASLWAAMPFRYPPNPGKKLQKMALNTGRTIAPYLQSTFPFTLLTPCS